MSENNRPSILKQLVGAVVGGALALGLYYGYNTVVPKITAYMQVPYTESEQTANFAQQDLDTDELEFERRLRRNREIRDRFSAPPESIPNEVLERVRRRVEEFNEQLTPEEEARINEELEGGSGEEAGESEETEEIEETEEVVLPEPAAQGQSLNAEVEWLQEWEETVRSPYEGSEELPDSGVGAGLGVLGALIATIAMRRRRGKNSV